MLKNNRKHFLLPIPHTFIFTTDGIKVNFDCMDGEHVMMSEQFVGDRDDLLVMYGYYLGNEFARHRMVKLLYDNIKKGVHKPL